MRSLFVLLFLAAILFTPRVNAFNLGVHAAPFPALSPHIALAISPHVLGAPVLFGLEGVADASEDMGADPAAAAEHVAALNADAVLAAVHAKDWEVCVAAGLGLLAWAARRFSSKVHFLQSVGGAAVLTVSLAVIGSLVPMLTAHASVVACLTTGITSLFSALTALSNPTMAAPSKVLS